MTGLRQRHTLAFLLVVPLLVSCSDGAADPSGDTDAGADAYVDTTSVDDASNPSEVGTADTGRRDSTLVDMGTDGDDAGAADTDVEDTYVADAHCDEAGAVACPLPTVSGTCGEAGVYELTACGAAAPACLGGECKPIWAYAYAPASSGTAFGIQGMVRVATDEFVVVFDGPHLLHIDGNGAILGAARTTPSLPADTFAQLEAIAGTNTEGDILLAGSIVDPDLMDPFVMRVKGSDLSPVSAKRFAVSGSYKGKIDALTPLGVGKGYVFSGASDDIYSAFQSATWVGKLDESLTLSSSKLSRLATAAGGGNEFAINIRPQGDKFLAWDEAEVLDGTKRVGKYILLQLGSTLDVEAAASKIFSFAPSPSPSSVLATVDMTDGFVTIGAFRSSFDAVASSTDLWVIRTATDGTTTWQKQLQAGHGSIRAGFRTSEGNVVAVGGRDTAGGGGGWVIELDGKTGAIVRDHAYRVGEGVTFIDVQQLSSGDLLILGSVTLKSASSGFQNKLVVLRVPRTGAPGPLEPTTTPIVTPTPTTAPWTAGSAGTRNESAPLATATFPVSFVRTRLFPE